MEQTRAVSLIKDFFNGKGDVIIPVIISAVVHGLVIYLIFTGGGKLHGQNSKLDAGKKLTMAEDFVVGQSNVLLAELSDRLSTIRNSPQKIDAMDWTVESTPVKIASAAQRAGLKLVETKMVKVSGNGEEERFDVMMKMYSTSEKVFDDLLLTSYVVGDGTLHSKFKTEKLSIFVKEKGTSGATRFSTYTREARRFYLNRISPQEFLLNAAIDEVKDW